MNLAKKVQFHFSFFKVDSQNPKFNLEYFFLLIEIFLITNPGQKQWLNLNYLDIRERYKLIIQLASLTSLT